MLSDGFLVHVGRKDLMVKIRGFRVEISEVERTLLSHPQISEAAVAVWEREPEDKSLVAYVVAKDKVGLDVEELRKFLASKLSDYMIPGVFMFIDALPIANGKLDRRALPKPGYGRPQMKLAYVAASNPSEQELVDIWQDVLTIHPIMAAKQAATIDHITGGRFALNVVTGWHRSEIEMFGAPLLDHEVRYGLAVEWLEVIKRLWTEDDEFDFDGKYFQIKKGYLAPKPVQRPFPAVMNAGSSETGRHYAAKYCDVAFVNINRGDLDASKAVIAGYRKLAREEYGRDLQIWGHGYLVQGETEQEAKDYFDEYVHQKGDWVAATNLVETMGLNTPRPPELLKALKMHFIGGWGGYPLIGSKEQIVDGFARLSHIGLDGVVVSWPRYIDDMRWFQREIHPLLQQAGLR
jgi:alkanesulfonate monooxygenase SsuD/methylene tetrahydromethanopterin reductase-like flavin-dependent oxidoreductase (luciferase family)